MKRTRQRFLWAVGMLVSLQAALALLVGLPVLLDAGLEGAHTILRICHHAFRPHYLYPMTIVAAALVGAVLIMVVRFTTAAAGTVSRTRAVTAPLLAAEQAAVSRRLADVARSCGANECVDLVRAPAPFAFCYSVRSPRICVSTGLCALLDDAELAAVLLHEDYHRRRREPLRLVLLAGLAHALSFWPSLPPLVAEARTEMEVAADASVVAHGGSARALARALIKVLDHRFERSSIFGPDLALAPLDPTAARIDCLTHASVEPYPPLPWAYFGTLAGALAVPSLALVALTMVSNLHSFLHPCPVI